jgi:hypothetical protein
MWFYIQHIKIIFSLHISQAFTSSGRDNFYTLAALYLPVYVENFQKGSIGKDRP